MIELLSNLSPRVPLTPSHSRLPSLGGGPGGMFTAWHLAATRDITFARASCSNRPFWRDTLATDWWMLDAFDECCVYDESDPDIG